MLKLDMVKNDHRVLVRAVDAKTDWRFDMEQETRDLVERSAANLALIEADFGSETTQQGFLESAYRQQARAWMRVNGYVS